MKQIATTQKAAAPLVTPQLVTKRFFGAAISSSVRSVDRLIASHVIPVVKLPTAPGRDGKLHGRCLIPFSDALAALSKFRINAIGEPAAITTTTPPPTRKRRMLRNQTA